MTVALDELSRLRPPRVRFQIAILPGVHSGALIYCERWLLVSDFILMAPKVKSDFGSIF